jgi:hypothetical protein
MYRMRSPTWLKTLRRKIHVSKSKKCGTREAVLLILMQALYRQIEETRTKNWTNVPMELFCLGSYSRLASESCALPCSAGQLHARGLPHSQPAIRDLQPRSGSRPRAVEDAAPSLAEEHSSAKAPTKDLKAMGLAAGGKLGILKFSVLDRSSKRHCTRTSVGD